MPQQRCWLKDIDPNTALFWGAVAVFALSVSVAGVVIGVWQ